jgi:sterol-4alpha-carboxylate 3-dehydrogenase (decarboxylating)
VPSIHACIAKWETPFRLGDGENLWDTAYVGNVGHAHALAARNLLSSRAAAGEVFFIQNNEPISFREFTLAVWKEFGHYPPFEVEIPKGLGYLVGLISECWTRITGTPTTISRGSVLDACAMRYASGEKARRLLGYEPIVGFEEGLRRSCKVSCSVAASTEPFGVAAERHDTTRSTLCAFELSPRHDLELRLLVVHSPL